jgi:hypothetical protein
MQPWQLRVNMKSRRELGYRAHGPSQPDGRFEVSYPDHCDWRAAVRSFASREP